LSESNVLWAEVDITVLIKETGTVIFDINNPDFQSYEDLIKHAERELSNRILKILAEPNSTTITSVSYDKAIKRFYTDADGMPNTNFPIEKEELEELIKLENESN
jgi:hypothetical protein